MTFKSAYTKLIIFYMAIVMCISLTFSVVLYQMAASELGRGLGRQTRAIRDMPLPGFPFSDLERIRLEEINQSSHNLEFQLLYFNLIILAAAAAVSHLLTRYTLRPIEESVDRQNRFTADASHELRTPLAAMKAEIEVALRDKQFNVTDAHKILQSNLEEIDKLTILSNALLELARYQDKERIDLKSASLPDIIIEAYEKVAVLAEAKEIEFENVLEPVKIKGDAQMLTELFIILLDNAIKYSPNKSKININVFQKDHFAEVVIKDQGMGIKASDMPHIFGRFYRADSSRSKNKVDGYGLGLSIAKQIVDSHKGTIFATSTPGKGSTFTVKLSVT